MKPFIDPDFMLVEHDPEKLRAHAVALLERLRNRWAGRGDYPIVCVKAGACWLLDQHADAGVPISHELAQLARELVKPDPRARTSPVHGGSHDAYWAAIAFDGSWDEDPPVKAAARHLAATGFCDGNQHTAETAVRRWRKLHHYECNVAWQRRCRTMEW